MTDVYNADALKEVNAEDLLALDFDQIEDVQDYVPLPSGVFVGVITNMECKSSQTSDAQWWEVEVNVAEHVEGASEEALAKLNLENGEYTVKYMWFNARIPHFKKAFAGAAASVGARNAGELFEKLSGQCIQFTNKLNSWIPKGKTEEDRRYGEELKAVSVVDID